MGCRLKRVKLSIVIYFKMPYRVKFLNLCDAIF
jgi:hypothetical protein